MEAEEYLRRTLAERDLARAQRDRLANAVFLAVEGLETLGLQDPERRMLVVARDLAEALPQLVFVEGERRWKWAVETLPCLEQGGGG